MRGQSCLWHYDNTPRPLQLPYHRQSKDGEHTGERCFPNPSQQPSLQELGGKGGGGRKPLDQTQALSLCALTCYWCWWTKRTGAPWVVHKGFELDVSAGAIASDVQPAIHGWDPCALSHRHWRCISARHFWRDASLMSWKQGFFYFTFYFFFPPPRQQCT